VKSACKVAGVDFGVIAHSCEAIFLDRVAVKWIGGTIGEPEDYLVDLDVADELARDLVS